jgi:hypothetical protein
MARFFVYCLFPAGCAAALTYAAYTAWTAVPSSPRIVYQSEFQLGPREAGEHVVQQLTMGNRGGAELKVRNIRTDCSCAGLETKINGKFTSVDSICLQPGEQVNLWIRLSVRGAPVGRELVNTILFQCNDPTQPEGRIRTVVTQVTGGVRPWPNRIDFGSVPMGADSRRIIDVWDDAAEPRKIADVRCSRPERLSARQLPVGDSLPQAEFVFGGRRIARLELAANTSKPIHLHETVEILVDGRASETVTITGQVLPPVELSPPALVLPRDSGSGSVNTAVCLCRSTAGKKLEVTIERVPSGLHAEILEDSHESMKRIRVTCDPVAVPPAGGSRREVIRLLTRLDGREEAAELPVFLR